jgi:hypothetical protein
MKIATLVTLVVAAVLFATMARVQKGLGLSDFRFGSAWTYGADTLRTNIDKDRSKPPLVVVPLLFPLDFLFLIFLGLFLALCSITYADALGVPPAHRWLLLVLPVAYMVADFSENVLYSGMLLWQDSIGKLICAAQWATRVKWVAVAFATLQALGAFVLSWFR